MNAKITVVKVKGNGIKWAQKCLLNGNPTPRYRRYVYKSEAVAGLNEWEFYDDMERNYYHNFHSAEELGIQEATK